MITLVIQYFFLLKGLLENLFFKCPRILPLWWESPAWTKTVGVFSPIPRQNYMQHTLISKGKHLQARWKCWWVALTWSIWQHRNRIVFLNEAFNGSKLMDDAIFLVWSWFRQLEKGFVQPYNYWSSNLSTAFFEQGSSAGLLYSLLFGT